MFLYKKIKEARLEKKLTQKQLANELSQRGRKTSNTVIANWESGLNSPDVDTLQLLCEILEKDGNYFFDIASQEKIVIDIDGLNYKDNAIEIKKNIAYLSGNTKIYNSISTYELLKMCCEIYEVDKNMQEKRIVSYLV